MVTFKREVKLKTPMLGKMSKIKDTSQKIGEFLEWIGHREPKLFLCELDQDAEQYWPSYPDIEKLLAEFYEIDLNEVEKERRQILDAIREENNRKK